MVGAFEARAARTLGGGGGHGTSADSSHSRIAANHRRS